jgi:two-component system, response regulator PdtaR
MGYAERSVLVVEDNFLAALLIELTLKEAGYRVIATVRTGEQAVEFAAEHHPELVVMDVNLAGAIDGVEAAARIRSTAGSDVLFQTAYSDRDTITRIEAVPNVGRLTKPLDPATLLACVDQAFTARTRHAAH